MTVYRNNRNAWRRVSLGRQCEEYNLPGGAFTGRYAKELRWEALILSLVISLIGVMQLLGCNWTAGAVILGLAAALLVLTQVLWTYRLHVDRETIREECWLLCIHLDKRILWKNIGSKKVRCGRGGEAMTLRLYDEQGRKRLHLSYEVVGFGRVLKRAKDLPKRK